MADAKEWQQDIGILLTYALPGNGGHPDKIDPWPWPERNKAVLILQHHEGVGSTFRHGKFFHTEMKASSYGILLTSLGHIR